MAGTCCTWTTRTTPTATLQALREAEGVTGPPDVHRGAQRHRLRRAEKTGHARGAWRAAGRRGDQAPQNATTAGRRTRSSWCRPACASTSTRAWAPAATGCAPPGWTCWTRYRKPNIRSSQPSSTRWTTTSCRPAGTLTFRYLPGGSPRAWRSRDSSQKVLNAIAPHVPWLIGGAADLAPSTKSNLTFQGAGSFEADNYGGRNLHFGIREHAMGSICNGIALERHAGIRLGIPDLQRLHEAADPARGHHGAAGHLYFHP